MGKPRMSAFLFSLLRSYSVTDQDSKLRPIGKLIAFDEFRQVCIVAVYKAAAPSGSWIWGARYSWIVERVEGALQLIGVDIA